MHLITQCKCLTPTSPFLKYLSRQFYNKKIEKKKIIQDNVLVLCKMLIKIGFLVRGKY